MTSVTVVTITLPPIAGSCFNFLKISGTNIPATTELIKFITNADDIKTAIIISLNQA